MANAMSGVFTNPTWPGSLTLAMYNSAHGMNEIALSEPTIAPITKYIGDNRRRSQIATHRINPHAPMHPPATPGKKGSFVDAPTKNATMEATSQSNAINGITKTARGVRRNNSAQSSAKGRGK